MVDTCERRNDTTLRWNQPLHAMIFVHPPRRRVRASISNTINDELNPRTRASRSSLWKRPLSFDLLPRIFASKDEGLTHASVRRYASMSTRNNARGIA